MKKLRVISLVLFILWVQECRAINKTPNENKKSFQLSSSQMLGCNSLKEFKSFAIHPQYYISSSSLRTKVEETIAKELGAIGKIFYLKTPDVIGYGKAEARLTFQVKELITLSGKKINASQASLLLASSVLIKLNKMECNTFIWSVDSSIEGSIDEKNESNILSSIKLMCRSFIEDYNNSNKDSKIKPIFYLYTL